METSLGTPDAASWDMTSLHRAPRPEKKAKTPASGVRPLPPEHHYDDEAVTREMHPSVRGYRIGTLLGRGDTFVVFAVTNPFVPEPLAMKVVTDRRLQDDVSCEAITTHAGAIAALASPHVARPIDAGRLPTGEPFVVTKQTPGHDLASSLAEYGPLPEVDARRILLQASEGLAEAHAAGIVHGDLRADRIVLATRQTENEDDEAIAVVTGFAAPLPSAPDANLSISVAGIAYTAPEQLGEVGKVDARADVWALGVIVFELMTGRLPFEGASVTELAEAMRTPPSLLEGPLTPLGEIAKKCLAHDPAERFEDAAALRDALREGSDRSEPKAEPAPVTRLEAAPASRNAVTVRPQPVIDASSIVPNFRPINPDLRRFLYLVSIAAAWGFLALSIVRLVVS